ncbi:MAG TPA: hypothetical protein VF057_08550 [Thermoanaerobaculia bacterium]
MRKLALLLAASGVFVAVEAVAREGFGFTKKAVLMTRTNPPTLDVGARRVKITTSADREAEKDDAATMKRYLEELILNGAGTLAPEKDKGDIRITVDVDRLDSHESWETRRESRTEKTGTKQEWNDKKKKYETKDVYGTVYYDVQVKVVSASLTGTYDIEDKGGKALDNGSISETFKRKYDDGTNAPTPTKVEDDLLKATAKKIASRLVPTQDGVQVLVPKGSFEDLIPLAEMNAWDRYLAGVERVPAHRDARQEAYRQYAIGLGKEGLAYATTDPREALELLREAMSMYESAVKNNPREKIFAEAYSSFFSTGESSAPLKRASASVAAFQEWVGDAPAPVRRAAASAPAAPAREVMTNQTLIDMAKAGLADENLILAIDSAAEVAFDTSPNALIALARGGVSKNVIAHMQKKRAAKTSASR